MEKYLNVERAVAVQSGTAGLHLAVRVLGVDRDHEVIVPTATFIAAVNPVTYMGAEPVFMDCGDDINIDPDKLESFLADQCKMVDGKVINKKTDKEIEENRDILAPVLEKIALLVGNTTLQFSVILLYNK